MDLLEWWCFMAVTAFLGGVVIGVICLIRQSAPTAFTEVTEYSNWGYWDQLNGETLVAGEKLDLLWPDGVIEKDVPVTVMSSSYTMMDHTSPCEIPTVRALVAVKIHDATILVQLKDSGIMARRSTSSGAPSKARS